jgi:hypothetical protein
MLCLARLGNFSAEKNTLIGALLAKDKHTLFARGPYIDRLENDNKILRVLLGTRSPAAHSGTRFKNIQR